MADPAALVEVTPPGDITFRCTPRRSSSTTITLTNKTSRRKAYKIKTTAPKSYLVKPNQGILEGYENIAVEINMQPLADTNVRPSDKFQVQAMDIDETVENDRIGDYWKAAEASGAYVQSIKLKVNIIFEADGSSSVSRAAVSTAPVNTSTTSVYNEFESVRTSSYQPGPQANPIVGAGRTSVPAPLIEESASKAAATGLGSGIRISEPIPAALSAGPGPERASVTVGSSGEVSELKRRLEEAQTTISNQEKMLMKLSEERNQYLGELTRLKDTTFRPKSLDKVEPIDLQPGFQFWHMILVAIISLIVGAFLSSKQSNDFWSKAGG